jgi:hypothetical protein
MPTFEQVAEVVLSDLCADCPLRNLCGQVEMGRLEADTLAEAAESVEAANDIYETLAAQEAEIASSLVLAGVYKSSRGCDGAVKHDEVCECGSDSTCGAYGNAVDIIEPDDLETD